MRISDWSSDVCSSDLAADALCRRVRRQQFGEVTFKLLQFAKQRVVLGVRYLRIVEHVIALVVRMQRRTQCFGASATGLRNAHCVRTLCGTVLDTVDRKSVV